MKYLVISDLHGHNEYIDYVAELIEQGNPDKVILLGDIMSAYGDRDKLVEFLSKYIDKLVIIKGNCDFPLQIPFDMLDYYKEVINGRVFVFTHGHLLSYIPLDDYEVLVTGHTHQDLLVKSKNGTIMFNPGSIALPRGRSTNSYGIITDEDLIINDVKGNELKRLRYIK